MRPSLRFLALAVVGWAGVRAATMGVIPGARLFRSPATVAKTPPIVGTQFAPVEPVESATVEQGYASAAPLGPPVAQAPPQARPAYAQAVQPVMVPVYYAAPVSRPVTATRTRAPVPAYYSGGPTIDSFSLAGLVGVSSPVRSSLPAQHESISPPPPPPEPPIQPRLDRWQLTSWALLRNQQTGIAGSHSLAPAGQLGASQAGMRLTYNIDRLLALSGRLSGAVGQRGGEVAAGVRIHPVSGIPVWLTAERRQRIGRFGDGRNGFALFLEGGVYQRPLPWRFSLDTYLQTGIVGVKSRDWFVDGAFSVTRPLFGKYSAGFGIWGGAQPGLSRLDVGPRVTMRLRRNVKVHFDWRQKVAGNARPGSGPALTLAGDF